MRDNHKTCFGILIVFAISGAAMVLAGLHYLKKFGTVRGQVVEAGTGAPVEGAKVLLVGVFQGEKGQMRIQLEETTGGDGSFAMQGRTVGGNYQLTVTHPEFLPLERPAVHLDAESDVDLGTIAVTRR